MEGYFSLPFDMWKLIGDLHYRTHPAVYPYLQSAFPIRSQLIEKMRNSVLQAKTAYNKDQQIDKNIVIIRVSFATKVE